jgi:hypothetical protein
MMFLRFETVLLALLFVWRAGGGCFASPAFRPETALAPATRTSSISRADKIFPRVSISRTPVPETISAEKIRDGDPEFLKWLFPETDPHRIRERAGKPGWETHYDRATLIRAAVHLEIREIFRGMLSGETGGALLDFHSQRILCDKLIDGILKKDYYDWEGHSPAYGAYLFMRYPALRESLSTWITALGRPASRETRRLSYLLGRLFALDLHKDRERFLALRIPPLETGTHPVMLDLGSGLASCFLEIPENALYIGVDRSEFFVSLGKTWALLENDPRRVYLHADIRDLQPEPGSIDVLRIKGLHENDPVFRDRHLSRFLDALIPNGHCVIQCEPDPEIRSREWHYYRPLIRRRIRDGWRFEHATYSGNNVSVFMESWVLTRASRKTDPLSVKIVESLDREIEAAFFTVRSPLDSRNNAPFEPSA